MSEVHTDNEALDKVQNWIDGHMHGAIKSGARGALQVLGSGFGKGMLVMAALATTFITGAMLVDPSIVGATAAPTAAASITKGLTIAGNWLLGNGGGLALLFGGGVVGSMAAAHGENTRISTEAALAQAELLKIARSQGKNCCPTQSQSVDTPEQTQDVCHEVSGGHCARLMQSKSAHQQATR